MLWTLLILAIVACAAIYVGLAISRARREQRTRSEERAAALLGTMHARSAQAAPPATAAMERGARSAPQHPPARAEPANATGSPIPRVADVPLGTLKRARFLSDPQRLLYLLLRTALPDHVVMANVRLVDFLDLPAGGETPELDPRLAALLRERIDCVVCRSDFTPLAALVVYPAGMDRLPEEQAKAEPLRELGIRFLKFRADRLPRAAVMRSLILG